MQESCNENLSEDNLDSLPSVWNELDENISNKLKSIAKKSYCFDMFVNNYKNPLLSDKGTITRLKFYGAEEEIQQQFKEFN